MSTEDEGTITINMTDDGVNITGGDGFNISELEHHNWTDTIWDWRPRAAPWALLPMLLVLVAFALHVTAARVLWVLAVRQRRGTPLAADLQQVLFSSSIAELLVMSGTLLYAGELLVGRWLVGQWLCQLLSGLNMSSHLMLILIYVFLLVRVILNRPMLHEHKIFLSVCTLLSMAFLCVTAAYTESSSEHALACTINYPMWLMIGVNVLHLLCVAVIIIMVIVVLCVLKMRRRGITAVEFQPDFDSSESMQSETIRTAKFAESIENLSVATAIVNGLGYIGRFLTMLLIVLHVDQYYMHIHQMIYLLDLIWESLMAVLSGIIYFRMYPDYWHTVRECFARNPRDTDTNTATMARIPDITSST